VKDANGQSLAYVYGRETKADADIAKVLTMDEARRIASNIAKLPELLGKGIVIRPKVGLDVSLGGFFLRSFFKVRCEPSMQFLGR
jgi:hypothetical protein